MDAAADADRLRILVERDPWPAHRLSLARIARAAGRIDPVFLDSPQFICEPVSERLGRELTLKVETVNPIRCFKGRGTSWFVAERPDDGRTLVCASAGNFGQGLAHACRRAGRPLVVYAARGANPLKVERMRALGAEVRLAGADFDAAKDAARDWAAANDAVLVVDGLAPAIAEGAGTIARELLARGDAFDAVVVPVGNGALITGMARWIKAAAPATRVIGVCSRGAPVMADAFRAGAASAAIAAPPATIADGIAVRVAIREAVDDMRGLVDDVVCVDDAALLTAMRLVHQHAGLVVEPSGAAGLAALLSMPALLADLAARSVATVLCGGNLTAEQQLAWLGASTL